MIIVERTPHLLTVSGPKNAVLASIEQSLAASYEHPRISVPYEWRLGDIWAAIEVARKECDDGEDVTFEFDVCGGLH